MAVKKINEIYKCSVCGNVVEVVSVGGGTLVCCGKEMELLPEKSADEGAEKHLPVIEKTEKGYKVKVGEAPHPMQEDHFIIWVELITGSVFYRKYLHPGDAPEAEFCVEAESVSARAYCNVHGLWKK